FASGPESSCWIALASWACASPAPPAASKAAAIAAQSSPVARSIAAAPVGGSAPSAGSAPAGDSAPTGESPCAGRAADAASAAEVPPASVSLMAPDHTAMSVPHGRLCPMASTMQYQCNACGHTTAKWLGRCPACREWGTIEESAPARRTVRTQAKPAPDDAGATPITQVDRTLAQAKSTHIPEFDRVLGGGLVPGAVVLLAGEPGVGKSTLLLEVGSWTSRQGARVLYVTGEESAAQVRLRAERVEALCDTLYLSAETDLGIVLGTIDQLQPDLLIIDSVQTLASADVEGAPGGVAQVREV